MAAPEFVSAAERSDAPHMTSMRGDVAVGKDVLELLSSAMYAEPLSVVREYIQNAADSIDAAYDAGMLSEVEPGRIDVVVDAEARELRIRDNGIGVSASSVEPVLVSFGASAKRGTRARGFRGVGRLGGLGFAQEVVFRTRAHGEPRVAEICWDCRALKHLFHDSESKLSLQDAVRRVVSVHSKRGQEWPDRFFEVCLHGVVRLRHDRLLNEGVLTTYLRQVAPLALDPAFAFSDRIESYLREYVPRRRIDLYVNGVGPLYRPFVQNFKVTGTKRDSFRELQLLAFESLGGSTAAVGWVLHHSYLGALQSAPELRGLRARTGDIQVGDESLFFGVFPEARFNGWVVGELHILDKGIRPNGRRDDFEHNAAYSHLLGQLIPLGRDVARRCRTSSALRARLRSFETLEQSVRETVASVRKGRIAGRELRKRLLSANEALAVMERTAGGALVPDAEQVVLQKRTVRSRATLERASKLASRSKDPFALVPAGKRAAYEQFLGALYDCVPNRIHAERLAARITRRLVSGD